MAQRAPRAWRARRVSNARPWMTPWSVTIAPTCTLMRMKAASVATAIASAAAASLRSTFTPTGVSPAISRTASTARVIAATVTGGTRSG